MSSNVSLYDIKYDPADVADSQKIGSYILAGDDGTAIGHVSDALKVSLTNASIAVTATDLDIRDLVAATDAVSSWLKDGAGNSISSTTGSLHVLLQNTSIAVTATDLDIRDLAFATDKVDVSGSTVALDAPTLAALENITVIQEALDTVDSAAVTVGTSAVALTAGVANRRQVLIQNQSDSSVYVGGSGVTTANGIEIVKKGSVLLDASTGVYGIAGAAGKEVRVLDLGMG